MRLLLLAVLLVGCGRLGFDAVDDGVQSGPDGGVRGDSDSGVTGLDAAAPLTNCDDLACQRLVVDGSTFLRDNNASYPATTAPFALDRYEVTVERFRAFVTSGFGTQPTAPDAGDGALVGTPSSGWQSSWSSLLPPSPTELATRVATSPSATYTTAPGANEQLPVVGVTWYEAFAFCIWDGGRLPTSAEHEAAAFGGGEQRTYPWGAIYDATKVSIGSLEVVGRRSPSGDARWGHADLVGNADEWALDYFGALPQPCANCVNLTPESTPTRLLLGGSFLSAVNQFAQAGLLHGMGPASRNGTVGFRCARDR
ncbi:MAG: formylglycine-generating enzyme family protein [Kofleriaceae bacterium]